jgi:hypothetical protein
LANIPASTGSDSAVLPIHQNAASPRANAVVYRQISGELLQGRSLVFAGHVAIEQPFADGSAAIAFIRVFRGDYSFTDVAVSVIDGGAFRLETALAPNGIPFVQFGLETTGATGAAGRLAATNLVVSEANAQPPAPVVATGFNQTVVASGGQTVRYGVMAANHPTKPLATGAEGRLTLEFLDVNEAVIESLLTTIVEPGSGPGARLYSLAATTPVAAAYARLRIERIVLDADSDNGGSMLVDAAFLHGVDATELPLLASLPASSLTVNAGESVAIHPQVTAPGTVTYGWYHNGVPVSDSLALDFASRPDSGGDYHLIATSDAGPVISPPVRLAVLEPDTDGDGISDYREIHITRTDPFDAASTFRILATDWDGAQLSITVLAVPGVRYQLATSGDLRAWQAVGDPVTASAAHVTLTTTTLPAGEAQPRFGRVEVVP